MNILITGGTGFIGSEIVKKLNKNNNRILVLTRNFIKKKKKLEYFKCNLFKPNTYKKKISQFKPETIIHCAWFGIPNLNKKNSNLNFKYSKIFLNEAVKLDSLKKILVCGSCFEIKNKKNKVSERCKINTDTEFTKAKFKIFKFLKKNYKNKKFYWLRIFYAYGPGQKKDSIIPYMINKIKKNRKLFIKNPNNHLDFIFVEDVATYFNKVIQISPRSGIYNVGSGNGIKIEKIFKILKLKINKSYKYEIQKKTKDLKIFYSCNKKSIFNLSWKPKFNISEGLKKTIKFI